MKETRNKKKKKKEKKRPIFSVVLFTLPFHEMRIITTHLVATR